MDNIYIYYYKREGIMDLGKKGEDIAKKYLCKKGYKIIEMNFQCKHGEIDIIAERNYVICFVEVKTRTNESYGSPVDAITSYKIKHLVRSAQYYIAKKHLEGIEVRLDVIEVDMIQGHDAVKVNHIENAICL